MAPLFDGEADNVNKQMGLWQSGQETRDTSPQFCHCFQIFICKLPQFTTEEICCLVKCLYCGDLFLLSVRRGFKWFGPMTHAPNSLGLLIGCVSSRSTDMVQCDPRCSNRLKVTSDKLTDSTHVVRVARTENVASTKVLHLSQFVWQLAMLLFSPRVAIRFNKFRSVIGLWLCYRIL